MNKYVWKNFSKFLENVLRYVRCLIILPPPPLPQYVHPSQCPRCTSQGTPQKPLCARVKQMQVKTFNFLAEPYLPQSLNTYFKPPPSHPISGNIERVLRHFSFKIMFFCYKTPFVIYFFIFVPDNCRFCIKAQFIVLKQWILTGFIKHQFRKR